MNNVLLLLAVGLNFLFFSHSFSLDTDINRGSASNPHE
jgi:hypothetical protein